MFCRVDKSAHQGAVLFARCFFDTRRHINHRRVFALLGRHYRASRPPEPWRRACKAPRTCQSNASPLPPGRPSSGGGIKQKPVSNALIGFCGFGSLADDPERLDNRALRAAFNLGHACRAFLPVQLNTVRADRADRAVQCVIIGVNQKRYSFDKGTQPASPLPVRRLNGGRCFEKYKAAHIDPQIIGEANIIGAGKPAYFDAGSMIIHPSRDCRQFPCGPTRVGILQSRAQSPEYRHRRQWPLRVSSRVFGRAGRPPRTNASTTRSKSGPISRRATPPLQPTHHTVHAVFSASVASHNLSRGAP